MPTSTPGKSAWLKTNSGLSLIELLVAIAIVGLILAVSVTGLRSVFDVNLKSSASHLASVLRYASNRAITDHLYVRVVFDFGQNSYQVEESPDPLIVSLEEDEEDDEDKEEEKNKETETEDTVSKKPPKKLPSDVFFKDIHVSYLKEKKEQGQVATYFFPDGFITPTLVNLRNEDDSAQYSVEIFPFSGRVVVQGQYKEALAETEQP